MKEQFQRAVEPDPVRLLILGEGPQKEIAVRAIHAGIDAYQAGQNPWRAAGIEATATTAEFAVAGASCALEACIVGAASMSTVGHAVRNNLSRAWEDAQATVQELGVSGGLAANVIVTQLARYTQVSVTTFSLTYQQDAGPVRIEHTIEEKQLVLNPRTSYLKVGLSPGSAPTTSVTSPFGPLTVSSTGSIALGSLEGNSFSVSPLQLKASLSRSSMLYGNRVLTYRDSLQLTESGVIGLGGILAVPYASPFASAILRAARIVAAFAQ